MGQKEKLIEHLKSKPKDFTFNKHIARFFPSSIGGEMNCGKLQNCSKKEEQANERAVQRFDFIHRKRI